MAVYESRVVAVGECVVADGARDDLVCVGILLVLRTTVHGPAEKRDHGSAITLDSHGVATEHGF